MMPSSEEQIFPTKLDWPVAADNLRNLPRTATRIRLVSKATGFDCLHEFRNLEALWCFGIDQRKLKEIAKCGSLKSLYLDYNLRTSDLSVLKNLPLLEVLRLDSCSKFTSLEQLGEFKHLRGLAIENFKNVRDLKPLSNLVNLTELAVEGSIWTSMKIDSLAPIANLTQLKYLSCANLRVLDKSLQPLSDLTNLRHLGLSNFYPLEEFARLSTRLPHTTCQWFTPYIPSGLTCEKCKATTRVMLSGKGITMLCPRCDEVRLQRHVAKFEQAKAGAC